MTRLPGKIWSLLAFAALAVLWVSVVTFQQELFISFALLAIYFVIGILIVRLTGYKETPSLIWVFIIGLVLRYVVTVILNYVYAPHGQIFVDDGTYFIRGRSIAEGWLSGRPVDLVQAAGSRHFGYFAYNAVHYLISSQTMLLPKTTNAFLGAFTPLFIYSIAAGLFQKRVAVISAWLIALHPTLIFWSANNLKDIAAAFLVAFIVSQMIRRTGITLASILLAVGALFLLFDLRVYITLLLSGLFLLHLILNLPARGRGFLMILILLGILTALLPRTGILEYPTKMLSEANILDLLIETARDVDVTFRTPGSAFYGITATLTDPVSLIKFLPIGVGHFLLTPLPWQAEGPFNFIVPGTILWYLAIPLFLWGLGLVAKRRPVSGFLLYSFVIFNYVLYAILFQGGSPRHQVQFIALNMVLVALGVVQFRRIVIPYTLLLALLIITVYGYLLYSQLGLIPAGILLLASISVPLFFLWFHLTSSPKRARAPG